MLVIYPIYKHVSFSVAHKLKCKLITTKSYTNIVTILIDHPTSAKLRNTTQGAALPSVEVGAARGVLGWASTSKYFSCIKLCRCWRPIPIPSGQPRWITSWNRRKVVVHHLLYKQVSAFKSRQVRKHTKIRDAGQSAAYSDTAYSHMMSMQSELLMNIWISIVGIWTHISE